MAASFPQGASRHPHPLRLTAWALAAGLWLAPMVAMQFSPEVRWGPADFAIFGAMLLAVGGGLEWAVRVSAHRAWRAGAGVALVTAFLLVWVNGAVGLIGSEDHPGNLLFHGVLAVGALGALWSRGRPLGMARALVAMAVAQIAVALVAWMAGWGQIVVITGVLVMLWLVSAWLFRRSAVDEG